MKQDCYNQVTFNGKLYPTRTFQYGTGMVTVATTELEHVLIDGDCTDHVSEEAEAIDNTIICYFDPEDFELPEAELVAKLSKILED